MILQWENLVKPTEIGVSVLEKYWQTMQETTLTLFSNLRSAVFKDLHLFTLLKSNGKNLTSLNTDYITK